VRRLRQPRTAASAEAGARLGLTRHRTSAMLDLLWGAVALVLVFEGLLPFLSPITWRQVFERMQKLSDGQIRFMGLSSMLVGLLLLSLWH